MINRRLMRHNIVICVCRRLRLIRPLIQHDVIACADMFCVSSRLIRPLVQAGACVCVGGVGVGGVRVCLCKFMHWL